MNKKFNSALSAFLAILMIVSSALCGFAVNADTVNGDVSDSTSVVVTDETTTIVEDTEVTESTSEQPEETTEPVSEEDTTAPEETTTEPVSEEETTVPEETTTEPVSEEETTTPEETTTEPVSEEETTTPEETTTEPSTEAPSEEETTAPTTTPSEEESTEHVHEFVDKITPAEGYLNGQISEVCSCGHTVYKETIPRVYSVDLDMLHANYDGTEKKPTITVRTLSSTLTEGVDYDLIYPDEMIEKGLYTIKISYKGKYKGETSVSFYIIHAENEAPELISAESTKNGVVVKWNDIYSMFRDDANANFYFRLYRKTKDTGWKSIASALKASEYTDDTAIYGETYYYTVKPYYFYDGERYFGGYDKKGISVKVDYTATPDAPKFEFKNTYGKVSWSAIESATKYVLYRSTSPNSGYQKVYTGTKRYYNDKKIEPGNTYYYKLRVYVNSKVSAASEYGSYTYKVSATTIKERISVNSSAIKLQWSKVQGADGYAIYRRVSKTDSWERIKTIKSGDTLSYTNKNLSGSYFYLIRAYHTDNGTNYYGPNSNIVRARTLAKVTTIKASTSKSNLTTTVKWSKVSGASGYELYAKVSGGSWTLLERTDSSTRVYTHPVTANANYYYKVRAIYKYDYNDGISTVAFSDYVKVTVNYLPEFIYSLPSKKVSKPTYITMKIKNNGNAKMRVYADGATMANDTKEYALKLSKNNKKGYVDYIDIPAGKTVSLYFYFTKTPTYYTPESFVGFMFTYNNGAYVTAASHEYGAQTIYYGQLT